MKNSKLRRVLLLLACAVLLVSLSVGATLAYLTSETKQVTNTFTVGDVQIDLDETDVDVYGVKDGETRVKDNTYKLLPGHTYVKDPTIHVAAGSERCWLFVKISDEITSIQDATTIADQLTANGWTELTGVKNAAGEDVDTTGIYWHAVVDAREVVSPNTLDVVVFNNFKIKGDADVAAFAGKTITVRAYAVQEDGFTTAAAAYGAAPCAWDKE